MGQDSKLSEKRKQVMFGGNTEAPFTGSLLHNDKTGDYICANCGQKLFSSDTKFDSGSGWPSFYNAASAEAVRLSEDRSHGMQRIEASCSNCGGHLGHVFKDAPEQPTGIRFCINSLSLKFKPREGK